MHIRRLAGPGVALALLLSAAPAVAQRGNANQTSPARPQPDPDTVTLVQLVDAAIVAAPTAQTGDTATGEIALKWDSAHFIKGQNGVYVPLTINFDPDGIRTSEVALYVAAIEKSQLPAMAAALTAAAAPPSAGKKPAQAPQLPKYAWDKIQFLRKPQDGRITRAIALPPGDYDVFVAVKERSAAQPANTNQAGSGPVKTGLLRHSLLAPDFAKAELQTSSVILATALEPVSGQLTPDAQEANPFIFGPMRIVPSRDARFGKNSELTPVFWVYGETITNGKPDVLIEFKFHAKQTDGTEKYFNRTAPQELNGKTLPEFNAAAGHQLLGSQTIPVSVFPPGDYRLEIIVTDKANGKVVTQNVPFTVTG